MNTPLRTRFFSVAFALLMTVGTLGGVNHLAQVDGGVATLAQASVNSKA